MILIEALKMNEYSGYGLNLDWASWQSNHLGPIYHEGFVVQAIPQTEGDKYSSLPQVGGNKGHFTHETKSP